MCRGRWICCAVLMVVMRRHRDAKDLVKTSSSKHRGASLSTDNSIRKATTTNTGNERKQGNASASPAPVRGALHDALARERAERLSAGGCASAGSRMNRLGGTISVVPSVVSRPAEEEEGGARGVAQLVRDPRALLDDGSFVRPQANKKRSKANFTYTQVRRGGNDIDRYIVRVTSRRQDPSTQNISGSCLTSASTADDENRVAQVLTAFLDTLLASGFG